MKMLVSSVFTFTMRIFDSVPLYTIQNMNLFLADDDEEVFMTDAPCMRTLIDLTGADKKKYKRKGSNIRSKGPAPAKMPSSKATTTQLVRTVFVEIFQDLMDETGDKGEIINHTFI